MNNSNIKYEWAYNAWKMQQTMHWMPEEVPLAEDVQDWQHKITEGERNLITHIFRFFTQADIEVNNCYVEKYMRVFKDNALQMMMKAFSNTETIHIAAYSYLLDTIGMPETEYSVFRDYKEMKDKYDYMQKWNVKTDEGIAQTLAVFSAFTEGLQLFASFIMLLNFPRFNKMKGMGQIISWSVRDESLHTISMIRLFRVFILENNHIWTKDLQERITQCCRDIVYHEDAFIDLAFEMGNIEGLSSDDVKGYIRHVADRRLEQLSLTPIYNKPVNPLPWVDDAMHALEFTNFFENRPTEYLRASTTGDWDNVWT